MRYALGLLSGGIAALDHRLIAPNLSGSGETISTTRSWRVGRGFVKRRATPSLRNLLAGLRWPRSIPSKTARNLFSCGVRAKTEMRHAKPEPCGWNTGAGKGF